jgi:hypothetical protein
MNYIDPGRPIALIGAGQLGRMAIELWPPDLDRPVFFLDENSVETVQGIPVHKTSLHVPDRTIQYVLSHFKSDPEEIEALFDNFLNQELLTVYDLLTQFDSELFSNGWQGDPKNLKVIKKNSEFFADEQSRSIYDEVLDWRYLRKLGKRRPSPESHKYNLGKQGRISNHYDLIIDGGSYDLSFAQSLLESKITWTKLIAVEPDPNSQLRVLKHIKRLQETDQRLGGCILEKRALWSNNQGAHYYQNGLLSARITGSHKPSTTLVETVTLEELLTSHIENSSSKILIKLHIEGAEWSVIKASEHFFRVNQNNDILINLSHDEDSLLRIPELLYQTGNFDLFLHSHALFGEGLTLFARSKGKL